MTVDVQLRVRRLLNIMDSTAPEITSTYVDGICNEAICGSDVKLLLQFLESKSIRRFICDGCL